MSQWVNECDQRLKRICAFMLVLNIPLTTILIYAVIMDSEAILMTKIQASVWVFWSICQIVAFSSAAIINSKSENFYDIVYSHYVKFSAAIDSSQNSSDTQLQNFNLLLNRLATQRFGFTVWDMVLIDRSTLLTTLSLVFTYFLLMVQFAVPTQTETVCMCNSSVA